jgi:hypothetical protein
MEPNQEHCLNCEAPLRGAYCSACGQRGLDLRRPIWQLLRDFVHETFDIDGRFTRSLRPFFVRPGQLTFEYNEGRRQQYTSPVRLFLFASLLFFVSASPACPLQPEPEPAKTPTPEALAPVEGSEAWKTRDSNLRPGLSFSTKLTSSTTDRLELEDGGSIVVQRTPDVLRLWLDDEESEEYYVVPRRDRTEGWQDRYPQRIERFLQRLASDDPNAIEELSATLLENVARAVFLLVPLYALLLQLVVRRPRRTYVEHLVMSLHVHAFVFVAFTAMTLASALPSEADALVTQFLLLVIAVYVVLAFRRAYASTALRAVLRSAGAFLLYGLLVAPMFVALALLSMATTGPN